MLIQITLRCPRYNRGDYNRHFWYMVVEEIQRSIIAFGKLDEWGIKLGWYRSNFGIHFFTKNIVAGIYGGYSGVFGS